MTFGAKYRGSAGTEEYPFEPEQRFQSLPELQTPGDQYLQLIPQKRPHSAFACTAAVIVQKTKSSRLSTTRSKMYWYAPQILLIFRKNLTFPAMKNKSAWCSLGMTANRKAVTKGEVRDSSLSSDKVEGSLLFRLSSTETVR